MSRARDLRCRANGVFQQPADLRPILLIWLLAILNFRDAEPAPHLTNVVFLKNRPFEAGVVSGDEVDAFKEFVQAWPHIRKGWSFAGHFPRDSMEIGEDELVPGRAQEGVKLVDYLAVFDTNRCHRAGGIAIVVRGLKVYCPESAAIFRSAQADNSLRYSHATVGDGVRAAPKRPKVG